MADTETNTNPAEVEESIYDSIRHLRGCPEKRTEAYTAERPGGERLGIVRCIDCGASEVVEEKEILDLRESMRKLQRSRGGRSRN